MTREGGRRARRRVGRWSWALGAAVVVVGLASGLGGAVQDALAHNAGAQDGGAQDGGAQNGGAQNGGVAAGDGPAGDGPAGGLAPASARGPLPDDATGPSTAARLTNPIARRERTPYFVVRPADEAARREGLAARAARRAYDGAPPATPHSGIFGQGARTCLDCHLEGMALGDRVARPMSHAPLSQCTQCHVEAEHRAFGAGVALAPNTFDGVGAAGPGTRASEGAPPTMPHASFMRGRCLSCHGEHGYPGLQTDHPRRAQCTQCHVADAGLAPLSPSFLDRR